MTDCTIDVLEAVYVEEKQHDVVLLPHRLRRRLVEMVRHQSAIGQAGQWIVICEPVCAGQGFGQEAALCLEQRIELQEIVNLAQCG
jgi:hypothetical protein